MVVKMRVGIQQPTYLPWLGYFDLIVRSDVFVFLDDVQYEPKSWQSRNRVKGADGEIMLTVPTKTAGRQFQQICAVEIDHSRPWTEKHWRTLWQTYRKARYAEYLGLFEAIYHGDYTHLADLNIAIIRILMDCFGINTRIQRSYLMPGLAEGREDHIVSVCQAVGADTLYDAGGAEAILDPVPFREAGITLEFQKYAHPTYRQLYGDFLPYMSAIDLLMNEGPKGREIILSGATWPR